MPEVARLANISEDQAIEQLGEKIYRLPDTANEWVIADEYLSGNVKKKLRLATAAAAKNSLFRRNVEALDAAQPMPLQHSEIDVTLGMPWVPESVYEQFGTDPNGMGLESLRIKYTPKLGAWSVVGDEHSAAATVTWGTNNMSASRILSNVLNQQTPVIRFPRARDGSGGGIDKVASDAILAKMADMRAKFPEWFWQDPDRATEMAELYNEEKNNLVIRQTDGAYLTTPGVSSNWNWYTFQKRVMARIIQMGDTYMAHAVGSGKTSAMIGAGMEMRRLGLARKPMYVVPNHMLAQFTKEFYELYPTARIAVADKLKFHTSRRKQFIANVAVDDLDAIVITHSAFGLIPVSNQFQDGLIQEELDDYRELLSDPDVSGDRITRGRIEKQIERLEQRLSSKGRRGDQVFTFEEMGVDFMFIDEAHEYRKLDFATKMGNLKGIDPKGSDKSWNLYTKRRYLQTIKPGHNLVLASGTPITNTMAELYTVSRYLQQDELDARGYGHFDAWAAAFGDSRADLEQNSAGNYAYVTRFSEFVNRNELSKMVRQVMDVVTATQLDEQVIRPKLKGGERVLHLAEKSDEVTAYQAELATRMDVISKRRGKPEPGDDIILNVINDGRHMAIDMRLVDIDQYDNDPGSKLNLMIGKIYDIWQKTKRQPFHAILTQEGKYSEKPVDYGPATQIVFTNLGLGARDFSVPRYIRSELSRRGVPRKEIAYIADFKTHVAKQRLFNDMSEGKVRVLIGSVSKMGTGVNVQKRLYASHNLDPLWLPADDTQRNGRSWRQGNMNPEIEIHDYATKGTYDSQMYGLMGRKAGFIEDFFSVDSTLIGRAEDIGEASQFEQAKAITTADPRLIELAEKKAQLEKALRARSAFENEQYASARRVASARGTIEYQGDRIPLIEQDIAKRTDTSGDKFEATIKRNKHTERAEFGEAALAEMDRLEAAEKEVDEHKIGTIGGFDLLASVQSYKYTDIIKGQPKQMVDHETVLSIGRAGNYRDDIRRKESALGLTRSIEYVLKNFDTQLAKAQESLDIANKDLREFTAVADKTFSGQDEIDRLNAQVRALETELAGETVEDQLRMTAGREYEVLTGAEWSEKAGIPVTDEGLSRVNVYTPGMFPFSGQPVDGFKTKAEAEYWVRQELGERQAAETDIAAFISEGGALREGDERFALSPETTETPEFKRWFNNSQATDAAGKPMVVYHGTQFTELFDVFDPQGSFGGWNHVGTWFSSEPVHAERFADVSGYQKEYAQIIPAYLSIQDGLEGTWDEIVEVMQDIVAKAGVDQFDKSAGKIFRDELQRLGFDGIVIRNWEGDGKPAQDVFVALESNQIKSALGNRGTFDPTDPRITYSLTPDFVAKADVIETDLKARLKQVGIADRVAVKLVDQIRLKPRVAMDGTVSVPSGAIGRYANRVIEVAAGAPSKAWVMDHEIIHGLRDLGVIRPAEWRALSRAARVDKGLRKQYADLNLSEEELIEEAVADMHADWATGQRQAKGFVRTAFERIRDFLEALGNALRGAGFQSSSDIFRRIGSGEVGRRGGFPGEEPILAPQFAAAFHGSPHVFDEFTMEAIGTGEGAQAFGWGLYFAENPGVAGSYAKGLPAKEAQRKFLDALPEDAGFDEVTELLGQDHFSADQELVIRELEKNDWLGFDYPSQAVNAAYRDIDRFDPSPALKQAIEQSGHVYEAEIPDSVIDKMLDWDKPLSEQPKIVAAMPEHIQKKIREWQKSFGVTNVKGENLYDALIADEVGATGFAAQKEQSLYLNNLGVPGIKFYDQQSRQTVQTQGFLKPLADVVRGKERRTRNIVVFDPSIITEVKRDGKIVSGAAAALSVTASKNSGNPWIGVLTEDGRHEFRNVEEGKAADWHHNMAMKLIDEFDADSSLRFVREFVAGEPQEVLTLRGDAVLDPFGKGKAQIKELAKRLKQDGAPGSLKLKVDQMNLGTDYEGRVIGSLDRWSKPAKAKPGREAFALRPGDFDPKRASEAVAFDKEESEKRWQEARKGVRAQARPVKEWFRHIGQGFARHFIHLPNEPRFSPAREQLRKIEAAPQAAKEEALRVISKITKGMNAKDLDLFTRKVVLEDLSYEVEREHQLPFGFSPADVETELAKVNAALRPELRERVQLRDGLVKHVAAELVRSGVLNKEQIKNPAYYRHQVLDYARAQLLMAKTPGKKLKAPHWARRMGSQLDINANLLEAEFEWLQKALTDVAVADTIEWFKNSDYNVRDEVIDSARAHNQKLVNRLLARDLKNNGFMKNGRETSPINEEWIRFKQRIAIGLKKVREALDGGEVTDIPREFSNTVDALLYEESSEVSLFPLLSWMIDNDKPGAMGAAMAFKAINQRKAWIRAQLGDRYADPMHLDDLVKRGFAPDDHSTWQPDEGRLLFTAKTIPEHVLDRLMDRIAEDGAGPISAEELRGALESVRSLLAVGGPKYQMVLPDELTKTFNSLRDEDADSIIEAVFAKPLALWKRWVLINPRRVLKYNLNNLSGDLDAVIAGNPKAVKKLPQAIRELWQVMIKGKTPSVRYREAVERGVFDSGLTIQEIPDINYMSEFENLINPPSPIRQPVRFIGSKLMKVWRNLQRFTWFRENWLRYAAYLNYVERLEGGESMSSIGYGAGKRGMVDEITDHKDRAALLARELVGDYGAISHFGKGLRRKVIPFYSWLEINTKRYWRFGINAWDQGIAQGFRTTGVLGASLGIRTTAYLTLRMAMLYGAVQIWNNLVMGDEEDELSAEQRVRLHLILGRDDNGDIRTLRFQGALSDFLVWIGFEDAIVTMLEIEKGRAGYGELVKTIAKAPVNKVLNGLTPLISAPVEYLSGKQFWPDVFQPRPIRNQARKIMQLFSVEHEYDLIFDRPSRGFGRSVEQAVVYKRNVGENAYNRIKGMSYDWLRREKGLQGSGGYVTPRSQALYEWRLSKKFGDIKAERKAYQKLRELGVSGTDLRTSIRRAHPLGGIAIRDRGAFLKTLTTRERELLDTSIAWYTETYLE